MMTREKRVVLAADVFEYLGVSADTIQVVPDPHVPRAWAVRVGYFSPDDHEEEGDLHLRDFLWIDEPRMDPRDRLEEVAFGTWPPATR